MSDIFNKQKITKLEQQLKQCKNKLIHLEKENKSLKDELENTKEFNRNLLLLIEGYMNARKTELEFALKHQSTPQVVDQIQWRV